jgi:hypothetical protein
MRGATSTQIPHHVVGFGFKFKLGTSSRQEFTTEAPKSSPVRARRWLLCKAGKYEGYPMDRGRRVQERLNCCKSAGLGLSAAVSSEDTKLGATYHNDLTLAANLAVFH